MAIREDVVKQLEWYDAAAKRNSVSFHTCKLLQVIPAAAVPILALLETDKVIVASLGALIGIVVGVEGIFQFHDKWLNYRSTCESLRRELFLFDANAGPYAEAKDDTARQRTLVERVATSTNEEAKRWQETVMRAKATGKADGPVVQT